MQTTKAFRWLAAILALVAVVGLVAIAASRRSAPAVGNLPPSQGPWSVDGLFVGMSRDQCVAALGQPTFEAGHPDGRWRLCWDNKGRTVMAHLDRTTNLVTSVQGQHLIDAKGHVVVSSTTRADELATLLPGFTREEEYRRGAVLGVLPRHEATWYTLERDGMLYSVEYPEGAPLAVWAAATGS